MSASLVFFKDTLKCGVSFFAANTSFVAGQICTSADAPMNQNKYPVNMKQHLALIVTRSTPLEDGLSALLKAMPQITEVEIARSMEQAFKQIEARNHHLALIDLILLGNQPEILLERIPQLSKRTQRILLADDVQAVKFIPQYAEAILINGMPPSNVTEILTALLQDKEI